MTLQPDVATIPPDDDLSDLDSIVAEEELRLAAEAATAANRRKLERRGLSEDDRFVLTAEVRKHEDVYVWRTVAAVALFHTQVCTSCGHKHRFFMGWMTAQDHKTDPNCRRLLRGMPIERVERRIEEHAQPEAEMCGDCAEAAITVLAMIDSVDRAISSVPPEASVTGFKP